MLIYASSSNNNGPFGVAVGYKSGSKRKRSSIQKKAAKRDTQRRQPSHKAKKRKHKNKKSLNVKNVKFLKSLGLRVRKKH